MPALSLVHSGLVLGGRPLLIYITCRSNTRLSYRSGSNNGARLPHRQLLPRPRISTAISAAKNDKSPVSDFQRAATFDEMSIADFQELWTRLCENDVEYNEMKHMCKSNELGGKDMKYKLRAKLIKQVRERLGKQQWTRESYGNHFKYPNKMSERELAAFFEEREIVMPEQPEEAVGFAFAIMVQDGAIDSSKVPTPSDYDNKNTDDLKKFCKERGLPQNGNKGELMTRLIQHDQEMERQRRGIVAKSAAVLEKRLATIDVPPMPPNSTLAAKLEDAVYTASVIGNMTLPELRSTAYGRGLPVYGTVEALQDRIMEVLRKEAVEAHAGKDRLLRYAEAAVQKLNENEVLEALALRGIGRKTLGGPEEEAIRLINTLVDEWIHNALQPPPKNIDTGADEEEEEEDDGETLGLVEGDDGVYDDGEVVPEAEEEADSDSSLAVSGTARSTLSTSYEEDPTLDIYLVCSGATQSQRESALNAARAIVPHLQSDVLWGTLNPATEQEPLFMDDGLIGSPPDPPTDTVEIFCLEPLAHGVLMRLDCPLVPAGTTIIVTAVPVEGEESRAASVVKESRAGDVVVLQGLSPGTGYEFTARLHNASGDGPKGEPYLAATPQRQGVAVHVLYAVPAENPWTGSNEYDTYAVLNWEHLHASNAEEIDIQLRASGGAGAKTLPQLAAAGSVVLPLGPPPSSSNTSSGDDQAVFVGSWANSNIRQLITSRPAFAAAARNLGFDAVDLLEISSEDISQGDGENKITAWLQSQGLDPLITRVAVRLEAGGTVVAAGIGRGVGEILQGAANMIEMHNAPRAVLEAVPLAAVFFSCGVVAGPEGVVALPPTEVSYEDLEEDFFATDLELEKFLAVTDGEDQEKVTALVEMEKESRRLPPGALGGMPLPSQRAVHTTPPVSLPPGVAENIRLASAKLFTELGIQDFAQFSGWVVPEDALQESGLAPAAELLRLAEEASKNAENGANKEQQQATPKTFAELAALHNQEQARLVEESLSLSSSSPSSNGVSQADKSAAVDIQDYAFAADEEEEEAAFANLPVLREEGEGVLSAPVQYGMFAGMMLDNRTREELLQDNPPPPAEQIPLGAPEVVVPDTLPALGELQAGELCRSIPGRRITFSQVDTSLAEVGNRLGVLARESAAVGLSLSTLPRQLVSLAAVRAGLPALARVPVGPPEDYYMDEDENDFNAAAASSSGFEGFLGGGDADSPASSDEQQQTSFDDIGTALDRFEWERCQPPPAEDDDSYDAIRNAAEAEEAAAAAEAAALAAAEESGQLPDIGEGDVNGLGGMSGSAYPPFYDDFFAAEDSVVDLRRQFPGLHPTRQRVWVLCGGEGPQRDDSLRAAVHAASVLQNEQDLLVETFFLDPYDAGVGETERRRTLLTRRLDLLKIGADDDNLLEDCPEFHPSRIRHPTPPNPEDLSWRGVWRLGSSPVVKTNVPDLKAGCETALNKGTTAWINRRADDAIHRQDTLFAAVKKELELAGLAAGGPAPWGGYLDRSNLPEYSFMKDWVSAAQEQCVVVLLALPGHPIAQGALQRLLESRQVPFTGPSSIGAELCADRPELLRMLGNEPPFHSLSLPELAAKCESEASADDFHSRLFGGWDGKILSIRPAHACGGLGVMRAANGRDLQLYYAAVQEWADVIPAELIAGEDDEDIQMPVPPPTQFIIEPASKSVWLTLKTDSFEEEKVDLDAAPPTAAVHAAVKALASRLTWPPKDPKDRWLEVKACLLGSTGNMRTLSLTATVLQTRHNEATGEEESVGSFELTPIPTTILSPERALEAKLRLQQIADTAGLGAAAITALVDTSSGDVCEVIVREVDSHPDLTPGGLLMRQAAAAPSPLSPTEVLRELLKVGMSREGGMDVGELGWLSGNDLYDGINDALLPGGGAGKDAGDLSGVGGGLRGDSSASASSSRGQYWGDPDVEIEPEFLGLSTREIWDEIRKNGDSSSSEEDDSGDSDGPGFMMD